jgi:hypothetical protein
MTILAAALLCGAVTAETEPRTPAALAAGAAMAIVPLAVFGAVSARSDDDEARNGGVAGVLGGLVLAPLVAHAVHGAPERGLGMSLPPLIGAAGVGTVLLFAPEVLRHASAGEQLAFSGTFTFALVSSLLGVIDVTQRKRHFSVFPMVGLSQAGVAGVFR